MFRRGKMTAEEYYKAEFDVKRFATKKKKKKNFGKKFKAKVCSVLDWCSENPEILITVIPVCAACITTIVRVGGKHINLNKAKKIKENYCYDPSLGHYWALKRPLKNSDWTKIEARRKKGERLGTILNDLKVLK